ncbi:hypothetical protein Pan241w_11350 [Gimesia alba]|uniref:Uncharacterized protein n=1 Tax=Gimesia alba TaxID=2527973 RepID=A0A517RB15_9PLAN|nr:hypothetical protein [Gimesia alba]QDT41076.1 hypothetical protein Pan241w_11350 [Gimesia alba]
MDRRGFLAAVVAVAAAPFVVKKSERGWIGDGVNIPAGYKILDGEHRIELPNMAVVPGTAFTLTYRGKTTRDIPFDASQCEVDAEVIKIGLSPGDVSVPGDYGLG